MGEEEQLQIANSSRFSELGVCYKGDVVIFNADGVLQAALVHLHFAVRGGVFALVQKWKLHAREPNAGCAIWTTEEGDDAEIIETAAILDTVVFSRLPDGRAMTLLPVEFRGV